MAQVTKAANAAADAGFAGRWTNASNAYGTTSDTTYATVTTTSKSVTYGDDFGFPDFSSSDIPDGSTITSVTINGNWGTVGALNGCVMGCLQRLSGADAGTETTVTTSGGGNYGPADFSAAYSTVPTLSNLRSASTTLKARVRATRPNSAVATTFNLDFVSVTVVYEAAAETADAITATATGAANADTAKVSARGTGAAAATGAALNASGQASAIANAITATGTAAANADTSKVTAAGTGTGALTGATLAAHAALGVPAGYGAATGLGLDATTNTGEIVLQCATAIGAALAARGTLTASAGYARARSS